MARLLQRQWRGIPHHVLDLVAHLTRFGGSARLNVQHIVGLIVQHIRQRYITLQQRQWRYLGLPFGRQRAHLRAVEAHRGNFDFLNTLHHKA